MGNETKDLSHWDFVKTFSPEDIPALICGICPKDEVGVFVNEKKIDFVSKHVSHAMARYQAITASEPKGDVNDPYLLPNNLGWATRDAVARWLAVNNYPSVYQFERQTKGDIEQAPKQSGWPWGNHNTVLLGHLDAAVKRFWVNFDPTDNTTAPTNEAVIAWLKERGLSENIAKAIATIIRVDGLPTGKRT